MRYGQGIDRYTEIITIACDLGLINKAGAWYSLSFLQDAADTANKTKFQGTEKIRQYLIENTEIYQKLNEAVKAMMGSK